MHAGAWFVLMLWKYRPEISSERLGQQIGVWMKKFVSVAPMSAMFSFVIGIGVAPPGAVGGKEAPSI